MQTIHDANAQNPSAQMRLTREMGRREKDAKKRLEALEVAALQAEDRAAKARAEAEEIEARAAFVKAHERQVDARDERLSTWQMSLEKMERRLLEMERRLVKAFEILPSALQEKLMALFKPEQANTPHADPKGRSTGASGGSDSTPLDDRGSSRKTGLHRGPR
jgi:hypothetical protein